MTIKWDIEAGNRFLGTAAHIGEMFGEGYSARFVKEVIDTVQLLEENPLLGPEEELLRKSKYPFRHLTIGKLNKIIYTVRGEVIIIADFWGTRMNTKALAKRLLLKTK